MPGNLTRRALPALLIAAFSGTAAASTSADLTAVRALAHAPALADVSSSRGDQETDEAVRRLLQAPLDADTAVRIALLNNRALRATLRELGVSRGGLIQARALPNPELEAEALPGDDGELELRVEFDLTTALLAPLRARAAKARLQAERFRAAATVVQTGYDVRTAFYALQSAEQRLALVQRALDTVAAGRDMTRALFDVGNVPELDLAIQEAAYERARVAAAQLELEVAERREPLNRLLGLYGTDTTWTTAGGMALVPDRETLPEEPETRALEASLELAELRERMDAIARQTGLTRAEGWIPDVSVGVFGTSEVPEQGVPVSAEAPWRVGGVVRLTLPLFNRQRGQVSAQEAGFDALMERYQGLAIDIRSAAREARTRLESAHARALHFQQAVLPAQQRVAEQMLLHYNAMQIDIVQLLQARRAQLEVELAHVETLREYWSAKAGLEALLAGRRSGEAAPVVPTGSSSAWAENEGGH